MWDRLEHEVAATVICVQFPPNSVHYDLDDGLLSNWLHWFLLLLVWSWNYDGCWIRFCLPGVNPATPLLPPDSVLFLCGDTVAFAQTSSPSPSSLFPLTLFPNTRKTDLHLSGSSFSISSSRQPSWTPGLALGLPCAFRVHPQGHLPMSLHIILPGFV